ncbi:MAG: exopolysaccharide biosynthesis polyprenyl glycosylphosphotransferase [Janthinobacterium lividum]
MVNSNMADQTDFVMDRLPALPFTRESREFEAGPTSLRNRNALVRSAALLGADLAAFALVLAVIVAMARASHSPVLDDPSPTPGALGPWASAGLLLLPLCGVVGYLAASGHYRQRIPFWRSAWQVLLVSLFALLLDSYLELAFGRTWSGRFVGAIWLLFPPAVFLVRSLARRVLTWAGFWLLPVVVVGDERGVASACEVLLSEPSLGYSVVDTFPTADVLPDRSFGHWRAILRRAGALQLVLAIDLGTVEGRKVIQSVIREQVPYAVVPQLGGLPVAGAEQVSFFSHDTMLVVYRNNLAKPLARTTKMAFDIVVAGLALLVLTPVFLVVAALVRHDGGPALFAHRRIGARGVPFPCLKFRTMVTNADVLLRERLASDPAAALEWRETSKLRDDPRVTRVGRILRSTSLDELPQLINVVRLQMSLVGPRPIIDAEVPRYAEDIAYYYETRPGITGLWQVSGRSDTSYERRVQLDSWYVKNWTMWHDIAILCKTIPAVLLRRGAH